MIRIVPAFIVLAALGGCASLPTASTGTVQEVDAARVAAINRAAQAAGVQVIWINVPKKATVAIGS